VKSYEASAKDGTNAETVFVELATQVFKKSEWDKAQKKSKRKRQATK